MVASQPTAWRAALTAAIDPPREAYKRLVNRLRGVRDVTPVQAQALIETQGALVLDVREPSEFAAGHLAASRLIPLGALPQRAGELQAWREQTIVVICHGGKRSATACWLLAREGFAHTVNVAGGILAWKKAGLPLGD